MRAEATATETNIKASAPQLQDTTTNLATKPKRKRGDRKANQYPDKACYVITEVGSAGEILDLKNLEDNSIMRSGP